MNEGYQEILASSLYGCGFILVMFGLINSILDPFFKSYLVLYVGGWAFLFIATSMTTQPTPMTNVWKIWYGYLFVRDLNELVRSRRPPT